MLIYEFTQDDNNIDSETRVYIHRENSEVELYQYHFKDEDVIDINCVRIPIKQFAQLTHDILKSYLTKKITSP